MRKASRARLKRITAITALLFLNFWIFAPLALAIPPGGGNGPSQQQIDKMKAEDAKYKFTSGTLDPPPLSSSCAVKAAGDCMQDYCGSDVNDIVTACVPPLAATNVMSPSMLKCWNGYGCGGSNGVCCVVPKKLAGECYWNYAGADRAQVTFQCTVDAQECTSKFPGATSMNGGFGCSTGVCCKMGKSVAQLAQSSGCYFDYNGGDKNDVHFICTASDEACKSQSGTPSGTGKGCQGETNTCCKLSGAKSALANVKARAQAPINTFCFTSSQCREASGTWNKGQGCNNIGGEAQGYCIAPEPDYDLQYPIFGAKTIRGLKNFIALIFNTGIGIIVVASAIFFVWGAFKYMVSAVGAEISTAKSTMIDSLIGLALGLSAYALLANINPNTLNFKSYEVKMINRLSFYNLKFCRDIPQPDGSKPLMFMDAGPPDKPKDFQSQLENQGYKTTLDEAVCGNEYFVEGSSATDVCMGGGCKTGGVCVNCSGGANDCKSNSAYEAVCASGVIAGNVISKTEGDEISADFVCFNPTDGETWTKELGSVSLGLSQTGNSGSSGYVGNYSMLNISASDVSEVFKDCASLNRIGGVVLVAQMKSKSKFEMQSMLDRRYVLNKKVCSQKNFDICSMDKGAPVYILGGASLSSLYGSFLVPPAFKAWILLYGASKDVSRGGLGGFIERLYTGGSKNSIIGMIQKNGFSENDLLSAINDKKSIECSFKCNYDASEFAPDKWVAAALKLVDLSGN